MKSEIKRHTETPEFINKDGKISYSDWVIGEYTNTLICPYRVVRAVKGKDSKIKWEYTDCFGEQEETWSIPEPDCWYAMDVRNNEEKHTS
jgi:hypothetical protein